MKSLWQKIMSQITWFRYLNNNERDCLSKYHSLGEGLIVRWENHDGNRYAHFRHYVDFFAKTQSLPKHFHEVITGKRKPYFDFDGAKTKEELYKAIEEVCLALLEILHIDEKQFMLFTSHGPDKLSAHLIIQGICFSSHIQLRELFRLVCKKISEESKNILDNGVYSSVQCLRIVESSKFTSQRVKKYEELNLQGRKISFSSRQPTTRRMEILGASLVSHVKECTLQPDLVIEREKEKQDIEDMDTKEIISFCREKLGTFPFKKRSIEGNIINLERISPSFCISCSRIHEHENPFIKVNGKIDVYFGCRRGKTIFVGQLGEDDTDPIDFPEYSHTVDISLGN